MSRSSQHALDLAGGEDRLRLLLERVRDYAIFLLDPNGCVATWNSGAQSIKGYAADEILGRHFSRFYREEDLAVGKPSRSLELARTTGRFEEEGFRVRKDGSLFWANVVITVLRAEDDTVRGYTQVTRDISDKKRQNEEREQANTERDQVFALSRDLLCVVGLDQQFRYVSPSWTEILGWSEHELASMSSMDLVHPADRQLALEHRAKLARGETVAGFVSRLRCKDGSYRWLVWNCELAARRDRIYAVARDVTDERERRAELIEVIEGLSTTLDSMGDGVIATNAQSAVLRMNPMAERLTGWSHEEAEGKPVSEVIDVLDGDTREPAVDPVARCLAGRDAPSASRALLLRRRDGSEIPIADNCAPIKNRDGKVTGAVLVFRDVTEQLEAKAAQERIQKQLILSDRLASVGTLAAGVGHEINNPLAYVTANLAMVTERLRSLPMADASPHIKEIEEMVRDARHGAERVRKIVRGLKTFSRADEEHRTLVDVQNVLDLSITMAFNEVRHRARLVKEYSEVPAVFVDDARLSQVFINLLVNAAQALPESAVETNEIRIATWTDESGRAVVEVRDTGKGIAPDLLSRVFDPFFTTKPVGVGTGLGLFICHSIVTAMGGEISAASMPGRGSTFRVFLPPASSEHRAASHGTNGATTARRKKARVLVIDDELTMGVTVTRMLPEDDVRIVTTAKEALAVLATSDTFDVIFSDLMMPEMSGMELYDELVRSHPAIASRVVFLTGGAFTPAAKALLARVPNERIEKPFDPQDLRVVVEKFVATAPCASTGAVDA